MLLQHKVIEPLLYLHMQNTRHEVVCHVFVVLCFHKILLHDLHLQHDSTMDVEFFGIFPYDLC